MSIPNQVQQQSKLADQMITGGQKSAEPQSLEPVPNAQQADQAQPAAEPKAQQHDDSQQSGNSGAPAEVSEIENLETLSTQVKNLRDELARAEQRNNTLRGMMRTETEKREQLEVMLSQLNSKTEEREAPQKPAEPSVDEARDRKDFGDDFVDMVQRAVARAVNPIYERLETLDASLQQTSRTTEDQLRSAFKAELTRLVPDWVEIDNSEEFRDWAHSSKARVAIIRTAMANFDAEALAEVFNLYKSLHGKGSEGNKSKAPASRDIREKVAPTTGRASQSSAPTSNQPKIWARSEIAQVFRDRRNYTQEQFDELQKEIFAAQEEGRVDYNS